jgi:hypothetical protein
MRETLIRKAPRVHGNTPITVKETILCSDRRTIMKPVVRYAVWLSILLVLGMACYLDIIDAQEQGKGDQPTTPGSQAGEIPGQERMGGRGQMT